MDYKKYIKRLANSKEYYKKHAALILIDAGALTEVKQKHEISFHTGTPFDQPYTTCTRNPNFDTIATRVISELSAIMPDLTTKEQSYCTLIIEEINNDIGREVTNNRGLTMLDLCRIGQEYFNRKEYGKD